MLKKNISIVVGVLLIIAIGTGLLLSKKIISSEEDNFRKSLKGEIVFSRRDGLYLNIYKINADGTGEKMLYHNPADISAYLPEWSEDGTKIYFTTVKDKKARRFEMDTDGKNIRLATDKNFTLTVGNQISREKDIIVELGNIYYLDKQNEKILILPHKNFDPDLNSGAWECSWSPDKKYIIFELKGYITIINKEGTKIAKITEGIEPDWKY